MLPAFLRSAVGILALAATPLAAQSFMERRTDLPYPRAFHGAAVLGDHLYVFGGSTFKLEPNGGADVPLKSVQFARILPDGKLGAWQETAQIPQTRHYIANSTIVLNDTVYILGGSTAIAEGKRLNTVLWNRPGADGKLAAWKESASFAGSGVSCVAAFSTPGHLHVTGGLEPTRATEKCWTVKLDATGAPQQWEPGPPLPTTLWFHHAAVVGGTAYVWGGLRITDNYNSDSNKTFAAPVLSDGRIGPWKQQSGTLQTSFFSAASATAGPFLMSFSPRYPGNIESNDVWFTQVTPDGMRPWTKRATDLPTRIYHAVATDFRRGTIYMPGGKPTREQDPGSLVFSFSLSPAARERAEAAWLAAEAANQSVATNTLRVSQTPVGAPPAAEFPGFSPYETAQALATGKRRLVIYFHAPGAQPCQEQRKQFDRPEFAPLLKSAVFTSVDVAQFPQIAEQSGVFRVPTFLVYDPQGQRVARIATRMTAEQLGQRLSQIE